MLFIGAKFKFEFSYLLGDALDVGVVERALARLEGLDLEDRVYKGSKIRIEK